jgi:arylsulfatase
MAHFGRILKEFQASVQREALIPAGAPLGHVPRASGPEREARRAA